MGMDEELKMPSWSEKKRKRLKRINLGESVSHLGQVRHPRILTMSVGILCRPFQTCYPIILSIICSVSGILHLAKMAEALGAF